MASAGSHDDGGRFFGGAVGDTLVFLFGHKSILGVFWKGIWRTFTVTDFLMH